MTPAARRLRMPFGGLAFAAVVSMIPGIFMFRGASGAITLTGGAPASQAAVGAVLGDAATSLLILLAMAAGLLLPKMALERTAVGWNRLTRRRRSSHRVGEVGSASKKSHPTA